MTHQPSPHLLAAISLPLGIAHLALRQSHPLIREGGQGVGKVLLHIALLSLINVTHFNAYLLRYATGITHDA